MDQDLPGLLSNPNSNIMTTNAAPAPLTAEQMMKNIEAIMRDYRENKPHTHPIDLYPIPMSEYERRFGPEGA